MQINNLDHQSIKGYFDENDSETFEGQLLLDRHRLWNSSLTFREIIPNAFSKREESLFVTEDDIKLVLGIPSSHISGHDAQVKFDIKKVIMPKNSNQDYIRTGPVKKLTYFPRDLQVLGINFELKRVEKSKRLGNSPEFYFEGTIDETINQSKIEKLLFCLSTLTGSFLWLSEKNIEGNLILENRKSKSRSLPYMGSGMMHFPIEIKELERLCNAIKWKNLYHFHLHYSNFCTTSNYVFQLYRGCALLDYLITLFKRNLQVNGKKGKTSDLYAIIKRLKIDKKNLEYLHNIFPNLPRKVDEVEEKFEFFELRDDHIHRGGIFLKQEEVWKFQRCIVSLNEVIRILIPHLDNIKDWKFHSKSYYKSISSKEIVDLRQELISWQV